MPKTANQAKRANLPRRSAAALRMASRGRGRMARRRQSIPAWRNTTRTSWKPPSPRPSNSIKQQRGRGSVPGGLARAAADLLHPKVDPARELLAKVKYAVGCTSGFGDFTYRKPNRRQPQGGALLPAHVKPIPRVTVIVDTSGAWRKRPCPGAGRDRQCPADRCPIHAACGCWPAIRPWPVRRTSFGPSRSNCGGGGTDMSAMIVAAGEERPAPRRSWL